MSRRVAGKYSGQLLLGVTFVAVLCAFGATAEVNPHDGASSGMPDVPHGGAAIHGQLRHPEGNARAAGTTIVLYALSPDGSPGVRAGTADANGAFVFENVSNATGIVYLVGARYSGIPYGQRVRFEAGQELIRLEIDVMDPSSDGARIVVGESSLRLEWVGSSLTVEEVHQLINSDASVIFVPEAAREDATPIFRSELPEGADQLDTSFSGLGAGFEVQEGTLVFWGPIYPGTQELRYRYRIPMLGETAQVRWKLPQGSQRASLRVPEDGPTVTGERLHDAKSILQSERRYRVLDAGPIEAGGTVAFRVELPETRDSPDAIQLTRVDAWLEVDDTFQHTTLEFELDVEPGPMVAGTLEAPLLRFGLPPDAELVGLSPEAANLGVFPGESGGLSLVGPIAPGKSEFSVRYRVPTREDANIDFRFPAEVGILNILIADTGVIVATEQLHRRRPFRSGTRVFLHRQAFQIEAGEKISLSLTPIEHSGPSQRSALFAVGTGTALCLWFVLIPLARARSDDEQVVSGDAARSERELLYEAIRDIDHDFETGKLQPEEHQQMREDLRNRALLLLQAERAAAAAATRTTSAPQARFCPSCGKPAEQASWRFCVACGEALPAGDMGPPARDVNESVT